MSGIAGLLQLSGSPAAPADVGRMTDVLAHRGPDGTGVWCDGPVALGHRMLFTTPESLTERLPRECGEGPVVITADARIDNRGELLAILAEGRRAADVTDSELIWRAYARWNEACTEHLVGDFAFAIWDGSNRHLFCARDRFGVRPFYYHHQPSRLFAFASEIKGLLCLDVVPRRLNQVRVADYLERIFDDLESTFYEGILRLPPAHSMTVTSAGAVTRRYWSPDPTREVRFRSDDEYAEAFREVFFEAVRCRLRSSFPVGSTLSGGLDSSSITCAARELLSPEPGTALHTYSLTFANFPECDELPFIQAVLDQGGLRPRLIRADELSPFEDLERFFEHEDEPSYAGNISLHWAMYRSAQADGVRVLLDGMGGDSVVSHGFDHLHDLVAARRWISFALNANGLARNFETPRWKIVRKYAAPAGLRKAWRTLRPRREKAWPTSAINPDFAARMGLADRRRLPGTAVPPSPSVATAAHYRDLHAGIITFGNELGDRCAAAFQLEPRYPFYDKRLVEFCLALPPDQKLYRGWTRMVMRRAMAGRLPDTICRRPGKTDMLPQFVYGLLRLERQRLDEVFSSELASMNEYVDVSLLQRAFHHSRERVDARTARLLWEPAMLALWLQRTGFNGNGTDRKEGPWPAAGRPVGVGERAFENFE